MRPKKVQFQPRTTSLLTEIRTALKMNTLLVISMVVLASASFSSGQLQVGYTANSDPTCVETVGATICTLEYAPVCAILNNEYLSGDNTCLFCSQYGNTAAVILQIGIPAYGPFSCSPLVVGGKPTDDPQCANFYRSGTYETDYTTLCTKESYPICARLANGTLIEGSNKCVFCTRYGQVDATIKALGKVCNPADYEVVWLITK